MKARSIISRTAQASTRPPSPCGAQGAAPAGTASLCALELAAERLDGRGSAGSQTVTVNPVKSNDVFSSVFS